MTETENLPNSLQFERFTEHLYIPNNSRIIFSGKFGIGKTTFLHEFFEKERPNDYVIDVSPVHYSISSNEDIIDLLKYDIIYKLLSNSNINLAEPDFTEKEIKQGYAKYKSPELIMALVKAIPKIGKPISEVLNAVGKFDSEYAKYKLELLQGDSFALKCLDQLIIENRTTTHHEDFYTKFIKEKLCEIKNGDEKKGNILIVDDLDRVDPEHIFRLFNVFAAHLHAPSDEDNKFGFDKVIFSCDIDNIQSIYYHKYGANADFTGYIDKFYSNSIFRLDNRVIIRSWIKEKLPTNLPNGFFSDGLDFLTDILNCMVNCGVTNFRSIKSVNKSKIENSFARNSKLNQAYGGIFKGVLLQWIAPILLAVTGDYEILLQKLESTQVIMNIKPDKSFSQINKIEKYFETFLLPVFQYSTNHFTGGQRMVYLNKYIQNSQAYFEYNLTKIDNGVLIGHIDTTPGGANRIVPSEGILNAIFWSCLIESIKELKNKNYLE